MNRYSIGLAANISFLIAGDLIIHKTDRDSLIVPLSQIEKITFSTIIETTSQVGVIHKTDGDSLTIPLSQIDKITFSTVNDTPPQADTILVYPGNDINSIVENNPEGTTFIIKAGVHRMQEIWPKHGNTFWGESGAILNGSKELAEFVQENGLYYAPNQTQEGNIHPGEPETWCEEGWERCTHSYDLFINDEPLHHVTSLNDVESGKWFFDYDADRIYFADNPDGEKVETSISSHSFTDNSNADNVTIKNLVIEKYANWIQAGVIGGNGYMSDWLVEGNEIRLNHGTGVIAGTNSIVKENYIHHNGQMGVGAGGDAGNDYWINDALFVDNEISYNNYAHCSNENGGSKFSVTGGLEVIGNYVHHNFGPGLWTDGHNTNVLFKGNWVWWNDHIGISHEISHDIIIRDNDVRYNGINSDIWLWGSQILIHVSDGAEVYNNTIYIHADGGNGIGIMNYNRPDPPFAPFYGMNNYIHHNDITHLGLWGINGIVDDGEVGTDYYYDGDGDGAPDWGCRADEANNLFDYNAYHHNGIPEKFEFCKTWYLTWEQFRTEGQEPHGTMDSNVIVPDDTPPQVCPICPGL